MNRVHPTCTERPSLNKECGWKGGDRSGLAHGQELTGEREEQKHPYRKGKKRKNILDTHRPSHGRQLEPAQPQPFHGRFSSWDFAQTVLSDAQRFFYSSVRTLGPKKRKKPRLLQSW